MKPQEIMRHLMQQVTRAVPEGQSELAVTTIISRPMWVLWCEALGEDPAIPPAKEWGQGNRIYGSQTIIVESDKFFSMSKPTIDLEENETNTPAPRF